MHHEFTRLAARTLTYASDSVPTAADSVSKVVHVYHSSAYNGQMLPFPYDPMAVLGMFAGVIAVGVLIALFYAVVAWRIFVKAGKPGLATLVPVHNLVVALEIAGRPLWWIFLTFVPLLNILVLVVLAFDFAARFGKGRLFGLGILFLGFVFLPVLAFGGSTYRPSRS